MPTPSADATKANVPSDRETALLYNTGCPGPRRSSAHSHEGRSVQTPRAGSHEGKWAGSSFSEGIESSRGEARPMRMPIMHFTTPVTKRRARWEKPPTITTAHGGRKLHTIMSSDCKGRCGNRGLEANKRHISEPRGAWHELCVSVLCEVVHCMTKTAQHCTNALHHNLLL